MQYLTHQELSIIEKNQFLYEEKEKARQKYEQTKNGDDKQKWIEKENRFLLHQRKNGKAIFAKNHNN